MILGTDVERLHFRQLDVIDDAGRLVRLRIGCQDLAEIQEYAFQDPSLNSLLEADSVPGPLRIYLGKRMIEGSLADRGTMRRALMLIQVCQWKMNQSSETKQEPTLFLEHRPWLQAISHYALDNGVHVIPVPAPIIFRASIRRRLSPKILEWLRILRHRAIRHRAISTGHSAASNPATQRTVTASEKSTGGPEKLNHRLVDQQVLPSQNDAEPKIAIAYNGHLNLDQPELNSDLFYWQMSNLSGPDLLVSFSIPRDPLDGQKMAALNAHGIRPIVLHPDATTVQIMPIFIPTSKPDSSLIHNFKLPSHHKESGWLDTKIADYSFLRNFWSELISKHNVKTYVTWYKYDGSHAAIADAIQGHGGVMAIYQRSFETHPLADGTTYADVVFGFAPGTAEIDRLSKSRIRYHVATGYLGDHRFLLLRDSAQSVRDSLRNNGAKHILAFLDENSGDDLRWHTGHEFMQQNYAFLLEKLLNEPHLGLVFKPKAPITLRGRLGPVAELLKKAEASGRCHVYEGGALHGSHSPTEAALAADIAIHGHLCAATAGMEAALAGVPTLLLDREGWPVSPLYRLGVGKVVFTNWEQLWEACQEHWSSPDGVDGLGDWSPMLDEMDPFRDGRSAERMGTYLQWMLDGFKAGQGRETVMAEAAERYCQIWGSDKITEAHHSTGQDA